MFGFYPTGRPSSSVKKGEKIDKKEDVMNYLRWKKPLETLGKLESSS